MHTDAINPGRLAASCIRHRYLIGQLVRRDLLLKYKGSYLGIGWAFLYPLMLLALFSVVFSGIFPSRWPAEAQSVPLPLMFYSGLIVFGLFSEIAALAPRQIISHQNYVKKIIFPVEVLPLVLVASASVHLAINFGILLAMTAVFGSWHAQALLAPIVLLPLVLLMLGLAWLLAAAGVFVRDLAQVMPVLAQVMMFMTPILYPVSAVPAQFRWLIAVNPLAWIIEEFRSVLLLGNDLNWPQWLGMLAFSALFAWLGWICFMRLREEFADVL